MIKYYNGDKFLGYLVGTCPKTGLSVLVNEDLEYFTPDVVTHKVVGGVTNDPRTKSVVKFEKPFELPYPLPLS